MHEAPSFSWSCHDPPTGLGGSCVRGRNTGETWKPGQAEACPHTAAMTQHGRHKKAPAVVQGRLVHAPSLPTVPTPGHGIYRDAEI